MTKRIFKLFTTGFIALTLNTAAQAAEDNLDKIGLAAAHQITRGSDKVTVGLLSTSLNCRLPAIRDSIDRVSSDDRFFDACNTLEGEPVWSLDHGTYSASVLLRIAPEVRIKPIRVFGKDGSGTNKSVFDAMKLAIDSGVDVIAFGGGGRGINDNSKVLCHLVELAEQRGITVVVPAGNSNEEIISEHNAILSGCKNDTLLSVTALNDELTDLAAYANYSAHFVQIAAPGSKVAGLNAGGQAMSVQGTTVSYLVAAGTVALRKSLFPNESVLQLREALIRAATLIPALAGKVESTGLLDIPAALN